MLDSRMYPHLLDLIKWRTVADKRLFQHITTNFERGAVDASPDGTSLTLPWLIEVDDSDAEYEVDAYASSIMAGAQVVVDVPFSDTDRDHAPTNAQRILEQHLQCATMRKAIVRILAPEGAKDPVDWNGRADSDIIFGPATVNWPGGPHVRVVETTSDLLAKGDRCGVITGDNLYFITDLVVHLVQADKLPEPEDEPAAEPEATESAVPNRLHYPALISEDLATPTETGDRPLKIVGGAQALRRSLGLGALASTDDFEAAVDALADDPRSDCEGPWREFVAFLAPEEYMAYVDHRTYVLQT